MLPMLFLKNAEIYLPKRKQVVIIRVNPEIIKLFQEDGDGY